MKATSRGSDDPRVTYLSDDEPDCGSVISWQPRDGLLHAVAHAGGEFGAGVLRRPSSIRRLRSPRPRVPPIPANRPVPARGSVTARVEGLNLFRLTVRLPLPPPAPAPAR